MKGLYIPSFGDRLRQLVRDCESASHRDPRLPKPSGDPWNPYSDLGQLKRCTPPMGALPQGDAAHRYVSRLGSLVSDLGGPTLTHASLDALWREGPRTPCEFAAYLAERLDPGAPNDAQSYRLVRRFNWPNESGGNTVGKR
jgi:hypothetical protein